MFSGSVRWLILVLIVVLVGLQYRLWVGEGSLAQKVELQQRIEKISAENDILKVRNEKLALEVIELKKGSRGIEGKARSDLGMIKENETFYLVVPKSASSKATSSKSQLHSANSSPNKVAD